MTVIHGAIAAAEKAYIDSFATCLPLRASVIAVESEV